MIRIITTFLLLILLSSCSDLQILTSYDDDADFTSYLTFGVVNYDSTQNVSGQPTAYFDRYLKNQIEKQMKERGYILSDNRDLEIYYYVKLNTTSEIVQSSYPSYGGYYGNPNYYGYYGGYGYGTVGVTIGGPTSRTEVIDQTDGTLIIDIVDVRADKVVWQGTAQKSIGDKGTSRRELDEIIDRIFKDYKWVVGEAAEGKKKK